MPQIKTIFRLPMVKTVPAFAPLKTIDSPKAGVKSADCAKLDNTAKAWIGIVLKQVGTKGAQARNIEFAKEPYDRPTSRRRWNTQSKSAPGPRHRRRLRAMGNPTAMSFNLCVAPPGAIAPYGISSGSLTNCCC